MQFRDLRSPRPGRSRRGRSSGPLPTIPNREHMQEGARSINVPRLHKHTRQSGGEGNFRQSNIGHRIGRTGMSDYDRSLERLDKQIIHADWVVGGTRAVIQARHGTHGAGTLSMDPHSFNVGQAQDRGNLRECKGVVAGLNVAPAIVKDLAEEARDPTASTRPNPAPPPGSLSLSASWTVAHSCFEDYFFAVHSQHRADTAGLRMGSETAQRQAS